MEGRSLRAAEREIIEIIRSQIMQIDSILQIMQISHITCLPSEEHSMNVLARRQPWGQVPTYWISEETLCG